MQRGLVRRSLPALPIVAAALICLLGMAGTANAVVLKQAVVKQAAFTGDCGQTDTVRLNLPRRASRDR